MPDILVLYHKLYDIKDTDRLHDGQEYVYQRYFNLRPNAITRNPLWDRRHIRKIGSDHALCYTGVSTKYSKEWGIEPRQGAFLDRCPDCEAMAGYYHRKGYPKRLSNSE